MAGCEVQQTLDKNHGSSSDFSLSNVSKAFSECFNGEDVYLDKYVDAYNELVRQVFYWLDGRGIFGCHKYYLRYTVELHCCH